MRIVLLGPPGSGKAELSQQISNHYGMPIITVNSVMQRAAAEPSELGRLAKEAMDMSRVSDELLLALLRIQMPQMDLSKGFVLVDLPKNAGQADVLDSVLSDLAAEVELVLNLEVDPDELMERLVGRITCDNCGAQYNMYVNPPMVEGVCDECGARVVRRPSDYEETISNRLRVYEGQMGPLLQYYQLHNKLHRIEADEGPAKVWRAVRKLIDAMPPSVPPGEAVTAAPAGGAGRKAGAKKAAAKKAPAKVARAAAQTVEEKPVKKKAPPKKAAAKKAAPKKATVKKPAAKKAAAKKAAAKKPVAKKAAAKKPVAKKAAAKKAPPKKAAAKKAPPKKAQVKKAVAKKAAAKKGTAKPAVQKKAPAKKPSAKKAVGRKSTAKRAAMKKGGVKKAAPKKAPGKRAVAKKTAAKKAPAKKPPVKKTTTRKAVPKKPVARKAPAKTAKKGATRR